MGMKKDERVPVRQGDVILVPCAASDVRGRKAKRVAGRLIVAAGEVTGHHHAICDAEVDLIIDDFEEQFVVVGAKGATIVHEEHGPIDLAPGAWRRMPQVELEEGDIRRVAD